MPSQLPIDASDPQYRVGITLQDTPYIVDVRWNGRDAAWYLDFYDVAELPIRLGIKVVLGAFFLLRCADPRKPGGALLAADLSGEGRDATIDDLGSRVMIYHYTYTELQGL
jgi:hypothetical protein